MHAIQQGRDAWNRYSTTDTQDKLQLQYAENWALYSGTIFNAAWKKSPHRNSTELYNGIKLLLKHVESVVDFYATTVYQGDLSTDGSPLADGTLGAIPIDPQVPTTSDENNLRLAFAELTNAWNWKENMTRRPTMGAALGDVLTELVDDRDRNFIWPSTVWPGYVTDLELDWVGNLRYYKLEYPVAEWNPTTKSYDRYTFKKEVTPEEFRYYKGDAPFDYYGPGTAVEENIYGFVPAIWDRQNQGWDERGRPATEGTKQSLLQVNSVLSQSFDYQRRVFVTPIFVKGLQRRRNQERMQIGRTPEYVDEEGNVVSPAEELGIIPIGGDNPQILQPQFDLGQTLNMVERIITGILNENPEAGFYQELRAMSTLTGPGVERALGDAVSRCNRARARYDTQTIKLFQMAMTMAGMRVNNGDWGRDLSRRQRAFKPYNEDSYKAGLLDFGILSRPVVPMTEKERLELILAKESITTDWGRAEAGFTEDEIELLQQERSRASRSFGVGLSTGSILP